MADVTWVGGTHRISDPGVWTPQPPVVDDGASVPTGHVVAINQTIGNYTLSLDGQPSTSTFDSVGSTVTGDLGGFLDGNYYPPPPGSGHGTATFLGTSLNAGFLGTSGLYLADANPQLDVIIGDVASPNAVIQQGVLVNTGTINSGDSGEAVTIDRSSANAVLVNNGQIYDYSEMTINSPITGIGQILVSPGIRDLFYNSGGFTLGAAVTSGQTIDLQNGLMNLSDPLAFRATVNIEGSMQAAITFTQQVTSALLVNHLLSLLNGSILVAQFKLVDSLTAADIAVNSGASGTQIGPNFFPPYSDGNIPIATTGSAPTAPPLVLPPPVALLPAHGPNLILTSGAKIASIEKLDGYTVLLEGTSAATAPSLNESSVAFGTGFALRVEGQGAAARFGGLAAVGYNGNDGTITATAGTGGGVATLAIGITDVTSPGDDVTILAGAFNNLGSIDAEAGGTIDITGSATSKLINAGNVIANGMVFISPTITGTGTMTVGAGGSLELGSYVATGQSVNLQAGTLTIDNAHTFLATVFDFSPRDLILLKGVDVGSVTYSNGALLLDGGADGTLHFRRPTGIAFDTGSFVLHHTGTDTSITTSS